MYKLYAETYRDMILDITQWLTAFAERPDEEKKIDILGQYIDIQRETVANHETTIAKSRMKFGSAPSREVISARIERFAQIALTAIDQTPEARK